MFRNSDDYKQFGITTVNCLLTDGGLGDHIGALVAVDYVMRKYPWLNLLIWVPDFLLDFAKNILPDGAIVRNYTEAAKKYDNKRVGISTMIKSQHTPAKVHPVDYAFHMLADEHVDYTEKNYLRIKADRIDISHFTLPEKYVVIAGTAAEVVKTMPAKTMNDIAQYVLTKGYTPVFIGRTENKVGHKQMVCRAKPADIDFSVGVDLIDQTNLLQTAKIIQGAKCFVGMDGGPVHVAGCTSTPIVVGYTFINPNHNLPIRENQLGWNCHTVVPDASLACRFCQTRINFIFTHDYRDCFYKDHACISHMTSNKFISHLETIL